jgi:hypothetical protein
MAHDKGQISIRKKIYLKIFQNSPKTNRFFGFSNALLNGGGVTWLAWLDEMCVARAISSEK